MLTTYKIYIIINNLIYILYKILNKILNIYSIYNKIVHCYLKVFYICNNF